LFGEEATMKAVGKITETIEQVAWGLKLLLAWGLKLPQAWGLKLLLVPSRGLKLLASLRPSRS
jgi:hypothetical protein